MATRVDKSKLFQRIKYVPHKEQWQYHKSNARFKIAVCGRRFGKSLMTAKDIEPQLFEPYRQFWIAGPTYDLGEKEFRVIWDDLIVRQGLGKDREVKKSFNKKGGAMFIEFPWRTRIEVRSASHPESLVGEGLDGVILAEAAKHKRETWERFIRPALADKRGWATFTTTPEGQNWVYNMFRLGQNPRYSDYESWQFPSWANTTIYPEGRQDPEILLLERTTSREWFEQEIAASFKSYVGQIYSEWDEEYHVKEVKFNPAWPNYIAFDWGYVNPLAAIEFQVAPDDTIYIWREHLLSYHRLEEHLDILRNRNQPEGYHITHTFGDSADPEATDTVSKYFAPCLSLPEAKTNWRQGIELVKRFLKLDETEETDEFGAPSYRPHLFVDFSCIETIKEFGNYKGRAATALMDPQEGKKQGAQKKNDHLMDALRYGLMHIFELGADGHLSDVYSLRDDGVKRELVIVGAGAGKSNLTVGTGGIFSRETEF